jgi:adenylate cyclase
MKANRLDCDVAFSSPIAPVLSLIEWLSGDESLALDDVGFVSQVALRIERAGLPVHRLTLHLTTLHPELVGRTIAWAPGEPVEVHDRERSSWMLLSGSPIMRAMRTRQLVVANQLQDDRDQWQTVDVYSGRNLRQLIVAPLCNADGPVSVLGVGTRHPGGFTATDRGYLERLVPALRTACELRVLRQTELSLLDTYIGPMTAQRVLAGRIRQSEIETIDAALMLCDLRGFTELSNALKPQQVFDVLNAYFEAVIPAIGINGGEVLKFMGDAVLAFFPSQDAGACCRAALSSSTEIMRRLEVDQFCGFKLSAAIALHYGELSYGNIGSGSRPDFTMIGPDVNLVSRIQATCSVVNSPLLMSATFNEYAQANGISAGAHTLKGFPRPIELVKLSY